MSVLGLRFLVLLLFISFVQCRILRLNSDNDLISDGVLNEAIDLDQSRVMTTNVSIASIDTCEHQYGFLPCAENAGGYIFQILIYQGLLMYGEKELSTGSRVLFNILGTSNIVGIIFRILVGLPEILIVVVSGVFSSKEEAQSKVSLGVGIYAGITVFTLTIQWGACVIFGSKDLLDESESNLPQSNFPEVASNSLLANTVPETSKVTGVKIDGQTRKIARIMLLSLIPYIIIQLVNIFKTLIGNHVGVLISLLVSSTMLLLYFIYQVRNPWMQEKSLAYSQYETLRTSFLQHMGKHGKIVDENGELNVDSIKNLFDEADKDGNKYISKAEMEKLIQELINSEEKKMDKQLALSEVMKVFDSNNNGLVTYQEFKRGCKLFIAGTKQLTQIGDDSPTIPKIFSEKKTDDPKEVELIKSKILAHARTQLLKSKSLITDDGNPNPEGIQSLFKQFDTDKNDEISKTELEQIIRTFNFGGFQPDYKEIADELFKDFDEDGNDAIDQPELINGLKELMKKNNSADKVTVEINQILKEKVVHGESLIWTYIKSILQILLGIVIITFLGEPLTTSILQLSYSMSAPSFVISFVVVPIAMNLREAIAAISPASHKSKRSASLTFSEIYGGVVMSNIANLTALLAIVYAKELRWDYSAEVLTVLIVCAVIGLLACPRKIYPRWTSILAFSLYPFSLGLFYYAQYILHWN